jgi:UPF0755 protein
MWRHIAANALTFFIVALFLIAGLVAWGQSRWSQPGPLAQAICFQVPSGANMRRIGASLAERGAIASPTLFRLGTDYAGLSGREKQGSYRIPASSSMEEIAGIVTRGGPSTCGTEVVYVLGITQALARVRELDPETDRFEERAEFDLLSDDPVPPDYEAVRAAPDTTYRVVLAEGVTSWQAVQGLNAVGVLEGDATEIPPEGMLAPDSYAITPGDTVADVLGRMQSAQARILAEAWAARAEDLPFDTPEQALTLASIVEKETAIAEERPVVASVLVNRIEEGMRLQFDPTIIYGITRGQGVLDRPIRQSDIEGTTEAELHGSVAYNTYVVDGLPAGPIANPGRAAIEAAVRPADTEYLYFVADGSGGHAFAETLDEHNRNVARWREIEAERQAAEAAEAQSD